MASPRFGPAPFSRTASCQRFPYALWRDLVSDPYLIWISLNTRFPYALWRDLVSDAHTRSGGKSPDQFPYSLWRDLVSDFGSNDNPTGWRRRFHTPYGVTSFRTARIGAQRLPDRVSIRLMA